MIPKSTAYKVVNTATNQVVFAGNAKDARKEYRRLGKKGYTIRLGFPE
uniref:Uncharacterized protein n=1 Tax=viral metagenome TaxID=1070528 RepID=A0A6M3KUL2_9ZZZZ